MVEAAEYVGQMRRDRVRSGPLQFAPDPAVSQCGDHPARSALPELAVAPVSPNP